MIDTPMSFVKPLLFGGSGAGSLASLGYGYCCNGKYIFGLVNCCNDEPPPE